MGGLSDTVQWWDDSQLRVLVLASLGIQYFLTFFAGCRKLSLSSWYRFVIWLSYLGSDALAIYALATLFNRRNKSSSPQDSSLGLEVLWAPFLLMHLGGSIFITAYNIEDNELWRRHIVTALSQVTVAIYVFWKSWSFSADSKLLATAILIFIPGILKCFAKPLALRYASFRSLADSFDLAERSTAASREELQKYVQEARNSVLASDRLLDKEELDLPKMLFVDFAYNYSHRLTNLRRFYALKHRKAYIALRDGLSHIFDLLYTKSKTYYDDSSPDCTAYDYSSRFTWILSCALPTVAIVLFHSSHKKAYRKDDVAVTIVLLYSCIVLEFFSYLILVVYRKEWPDTIAQRSILGQFAHNKRHEKLMSWAACLRCKGLLDQYWSSVESSHSSQDITTLVRTHVQDGWKDYIRDAQSYREFNDIRGQWTLERESCHGRLSWSLEKPFDESVLLWHIATDLCFHYIGATLDYSRPCREMSNYMMHLLVVNPEMLMPGSRRSLFATVYNELEAILEGAEDTLMEEDKISKQVIDKVKTAQDTSTKETFICDAWLLAEGLMDLGGEKMWRVIQGVWLEMMCFSASRSRGYLHAKALGTGGEYLSYVWLMLAYSGMETFPERLQRTQKLHYSTENRKRHQSEGEDVAGPFASQGREEETMADPSAPRGMEEETIAAPSASRGMEEDTTAAPSTSQGDCAVEIIVSP